jgi:GxxExxY protein
LRIAGLSVESGRRIPLEYKERSISGELKLDLVVEDCIVVELKAVEQIHPIHQTQVITYLKLTGCPAGLLEVSGISCVRRG